MPPNNKPPVGLSILFIAGRFKGGELPLKQSDEVLIGRDPDVDLVLDEVGVSRQHAKVSTWQNELELRDLGSTNGTYVNGKKVDRVKLATGDRVLIGQSLMQVVVDPVM